MRRKRAAELAKMQADFYRLKFKRAEATPPNSVQPRRPRQVRAGISAAYAAGQAAIAAMEPRNGMSSSAPAAAARGADAASLAQVDIEAIEDINDLQEAVRLVHEQAHARARARGELVTVALPATCDLQLNAAIISESVMRRYVQWLRGNEQ